MKLFLHIIILGLLVLVTYQDFRNRAISWLILPVIFGAFSIDTILKTDFNSFIHSFLFNASFILIQIISVTLYFSLRFRTIINITKKHIGWGDILFFIVVAAVFSPLNFIFFYIISLFLILTGSLLFHLFKQKPIKTIPLAGVMAIFLIVAFLFGNFTGEFDLHNDQLFLSLRVPLP